MTTDPHQPHRPDQHATTAPAGAPRPDSAVVSDPGAPDATGSRGSKGSKNHGGDGVQPENAVKFTRAAALWSSLIVGFVILIVLLIFVAQNTESATFHFFGWDWSLPLGVAILLAAVGGGLLTVFVGAARIVQLRRAAKKNFKAALR